jgi:hypothetical protein
LGSGVTAQKSLYQNLTSKDSEIPYISFSNIPVVLEQDDVFKLHGHKFIKTKTGLYVFIDGTGRLYKQTGTDTAQWKRIDSTIHFGYNIAAFPFSYQDKIYNLGGYGLWRINGQLRIFNKEESTWDIIKLNKEIPLLFDERNNLLWYDHRNGFVFLGYATQRNEAVKTKEIDETLLDFTVRKLDLNRKEWTDIGELSNPLKEKIQTVVTITMSPWGQLVTLGDKINLINYQQNKLLLLSTNKPGYQTIFRKKSGNLFYFKDSTLYYGNITNNTLDSIPFSYSDFSDTGIPVFLPLTKESELGKYIFILLGSIFFIGCLLWLLSKKYTLRLYRKEHITTGNNQQVLNRPNTSTLFEEIELNLLQLIINNTASGRLTSIEEINKVLGLLKRNPEIQKKQRSDVISSINQKYNFVYPDQPAIILKQRSSEDRRSFDYFILFENLETIKSLIP